MTRYGLLRAGFRLLFGCLFLLVGVASAQKTDTNVVSIRIRDACDPTTFNEAVAPGACIAGQHGITKFQFFIDEVAADHLAGAWRFNPLFRPLHVPTGQLTVLENDGGEIHTFTKVAKFGGGFVPVLTCRETLSRHQSAYSCRARPVYSLKPALPRQDQQQVQPSYPLAPRIFNAAFTLGCA
jgi:hypothetical protein